MHFSVVFPLPLAVGQPFFCLELKQEMIHKCEIMLLLRKMHEYGVPSWKNLCTMRIGCHLGVSVAMFKCHLTSILGIIVFESKIFKFLLFVNRMFWGYFEVRGVLFFQGFDELLQLANHGQHKNVDMLVNIYEFIYIIYQYSLFELVLLYIHDIQIYIYIYIYIYI